MRRFETVRFSRVSLIQLVSVLLECIEKRLPDLCNYCFLVLTSLDMYIEAYEGKLAP